MRQLLPLVGIASSITYGYLATLSPATAQIVPDNTLRVNSRVTPLCTDCTINGGTIRGVNLFHSFSQFSVVKGGEAFFNNGLQIQNIFTRVTGNSVSKIDGLIRANGTANLFLINPNGISFGARARLNLGGSFFASTASSLVFADGTVFSAAPDTSTPPLLTLSVPLGLQYGSNPGSIRVQGANLGVEPGQTLALVGGNVQLNGGVLYTPFKPPGGRVELGGLAGEGTVGLVANGEYLGLSFPVGVPRGNVSLSNGAVVDVVARGGGSIGVNAFNLTMTQGSELAAGIAQGSGSVDAVAGNIEINATGAIDLAESSLIVNEVLQKGVGNGGDINITTGSLAVTGGAQLSASTFGEGKAGSVIITARDTVVFEGVASNGRSSGAFSSVVQGGKGNGGDINITTGSLAVTGGAQLSASTLGEGKAGSVIITARDTVAFEGVASNGRSSGAFSSVVQGGKGNGGDINITTGSLRVTGGAQLIAGTLGEGKAGSVIITARDTVAFDGIGSNGSSSAAFSRVEQGGIGEGGNINITTGSLRVTGGAQLIAGTRGEGKAGSVIITARDTVAFDGVGSNGRSSAAFSRVEQGGKGDGGNINITTGSLAVTGGAQLIAGTRGEGKAGSMIITARDTVAFDGIGSNGRSSVASSRVEQGGKGDGGNINITTGSLAVTGGAQLSASTFGEGKAGSVIITARDTVAFDGVGSDRFSSAASSRVEQGGKGDGGDINITTGSLSVTGGAELVASTFGQGDAGNVIINAHDTVTFDGVGNRGFSSGAFTTVRETGVGNGGNINITTDSLVVTNAAVVTARTRGQGNGGNITVHANTLEAANGGQVLTASDGIGKAGDITLNVTQNLTLSGSDPTYLARLAQFGFVVIDNVGSASGVFANTLSTSTNQGGNLTINTGQLTVRDGAQVSVKSEGTGNAGNVDITANRVQLNNQGQLIAETASGGGGNIKLQVEDLLLMRHNSLISAQAFNNGNGGNIRIKPGLIVAVPKENSDIVADAQQGNGGRINITTQGIFGLEFRRQRTPKSEITANSQFGISGTVNITRLGVDPSQGLTALSVNLVDRTNQIDQGCSASGENGENKFTVTGRGGLPSTPNELLSPDMVQDDFGTLATETKTRSDATPSSHPTNSPKQLVEAQGWMIGWDGKVILTATGSNATPQQGWQIPTNCQVSQPSSNAVPQ